jgi:two-component sensor histidine kinase
VSALSATQNLLAESAWEGLSIADLLEVELTPYIAPRGPRVSMKGLSIDVSRDAAVALGLVFHELVTNAVKHGALSNETGQIVVTGEQLSDGTVELVWREEGGPPVIPPAKSGFGQTVIARGLGHSASEETRVEFRPNGLVCSMKLSTDALR